jgi:hypothetical protein
VKNGSTILGQSWCNMIHIFTVDSQVFHFRAPESLVYAAVLISHCFNVVNGIQSLEKR